MVVSPQGVKIMVSIEYVAGFIDGEGSIAIGKNFTYASGKRNYYLRLSVHQMDRRPLDKLVERYGGSLTLNRSHRPNAIWQWVVSGSTAAGVIGEIRPFLISKLEQADLGLAFQSRKGLHGSRAVSESELEIQGELHRQMRELKTTNRASNNALREEASTP